MNLELWIALLLSLGTLFVSAVLITIAITHVASALRELEETHRCATGVRRMEPRKEN